MDPLTTPWGTSQHDARGSATRAHAGKAGRHQETTTATAGRGGRTAVRASRRPCRRRSEGQGQWPWGTGRGSRAQWAGDAASSARRGATRRGRGRGGTTRWRRRARRWRRCTGLSSQGIDSRPRLGSRLRSQDAMTLTPSHASVCGRGHGGPPSHLRSVEAVLHGGPVGPENARTCLPGDERAAIERSVLRGIVEAAVAALEKWHSRRVDTMGRSSACRSTGKDRTEEQRKRSGPPSPAGGRGAGTLGRPKAGGGGPFRPHATGLRRRRGCGR
jgi:hypothetical protein